MRIDEPSEYAKTVSRKLRKHEFGALVRMMVPGDFYSLGIVMGESPKFLPLLQATGQHVRLAHAGYIFFGGLGGLLIAHWSESWLPFEALLVATMLAAFSMIFAVFLAFAKVRCPRCELPWVRWSVANQPHNQWLHWLYEFTVCPKCGHSAPSLDEFSNRSIEAS